MSEQSKVSLLVDGEILKQHILRSGEQHTAQIVLQYLHHMVQKIKENFPNTDVRVNYFGVRPADNIKKPISGEPYEDPNIKLALNYAKFPDAELKTFWSRMYYPYEMPWAIKPESRDKKVLTDDDFYFNEQPKGLLTQLVNMMAEKAVAHRDERLFVYGDEEDMAYALETTNGLDMPVNQVLLDRKRPYIVEVSQSKEPTIVNKNTLTEVSVALREPWAKNETLNHCLELLRELMDEDDKDVFLMLDMGYVRQYLFDHGLRMSLQNVQKILEQVQKGLPETPTKTIFYHAKSLADKYKGTPLSLEESPIEFQLEKKNFPIPNLELSLGKIRESKLFPLLLKREKWRAPVGMRMREDFFPNIRQCDVDDRVAYDLALARLNPNVKRVFLLSGDSDFVHSVEEAKLAGLQVSLIVLSGESRKLSVRLTKEVGELLDVDIDFNELAKRQDEKEIIRQKNEEEKRARLRLAQQQKRLSARLDAEDDDDEYAGFIPKGPSKEDRWGKARIKHKKIARQIITKRRGTYGK
ncbi:MAG: NYN domain-containing protein [Alphaproteobacteria bacterium]|nr:NYN domain-containing protein [Alphaproteobacteria bacterium]